MKVPGPGRAHTRRPPQEKRFLSQQGDFGGETAAAHGCIHRASTRQNSCLPRERRPPAPTPHAASRSDFGLTGGSRTSKWHSCAHLSLKCCFCTGELKAGFKWVGLFAGRLPLWRLPSGPVAKMNRKLIILLTGWSSCPCLVQVCCRDLECPWAWFCHSSWFPQPHRGLRHVRIFCSVQRLILGPWWGECSSGGCTLTGRARPDIPQFSPELSWWLRKLPLLAEC